MIFVADIGNSSITIGFYDNDELVSIHRLKTVKGEAVKYWEAKIKDIKADYNVDGCIIASVVEELTGIFRQACDNVFGVDSIELTPKINFGLGIKTENPETIGADRLANAIGALNYKLPVIVVDVGTAVTFDIVDKNNTFIGGVIMPGLNSQMKSLWENTSKLPMIEVKNSPVAIGYDTETCILSGVVRGTASAIDGLITQCEKELGEKATLIGTGGQIELVSEYMTKRFDVIDKNYTINSLYSIYCSRKSV